MLTGSLLGNRFWLLGSGSRFDGVFTITNVGSTSIQYANAGTVEAAAAVTSGIAVNTTQSYLVTLNTTSAHNYSVGDIITVATSIATTAVVSNRSASTTACTLTTVSTHNFSVGEQITVSGIGARYDGTFIISAVNAGSKTLTYLFDGSSESSTASSGAILNNMIASGYNGTKVIETIPSSTSLTYNYYGQDASTSSTLLGMTPTIVNDTNTSLNGTITITSTPSANQFGYTKVA